jgi:hypothetical protein
VMAREEAMPPRRIHVALGVVDVARSVVDYSARLGCAPSVHVPDQYALWRCDEVNFSIRRTGGAPALRHLGWEDPSAAYFSEETDVNGILWERFSDEQQQAEIERHWPTQSRRF